MVDSEDEDYQHSVIDPKYDAVAAVLMRHSPYSPRVISPSAARRSPTQVIRGLSVLNEDNPNYATSPPAADEDRLVICAKPPTIDVTHVWTDLIGREGRTPMRTRPFSMADVSLQRGVLVWRHYQGDNSVQCGLVRDIPLPSSTPMSFRSCGRGVKGTNARPTLRTRGRLIVLSQHALGPGGICTTPQAAWKRLFAP